MWWHLFSLILQWLYHPTGTKKSPVLVGPTPHQVLPRMVRPRPWNCARGHDDQRASIVPYLSISNGRNVVHILRRIISSNADHDEWWWWECQNSSTLATVQIWLGFVLSWWSMSYILLCDHIQYDTGTNDFVIGETLRLSSDCGNGGRYGLFSPLDTKIGTTTTMYQEEPGSDRLWRVRVRHCQ